MVENSEEEELEEEGMEHSLSEQEDEEEEQQQQQKQQEEESSAEQAILSGFKGKPPPSLPSSSQTSAYDSTVYKGEELRRYEHFRRSHLKKRKVKQLVAQVLGVKGLPRGETALFSAAKLDDVAIALAGAAKVFIAEIVEEAQQMRAEAKSSEATTEAKTATAVAVATGEAETDAGDRNKESDAHDPKPLTPIEITAAYKRLRRSRPESVCPSSAAFNFKYKGGF